MTDYHVIYVDIAPDEPRVDVSARIEKECKIAAREGWYLKSMMPDVREGTTRGAWLLFASAEDMASGDSMVAAATEILTSSERERANG